MILYVTMLYDKDYVIKKQDVYAKGEMTSLGFSMALR